MARFAYAFIYPWVFRTRAEGSTRSKTWADRRRSLLLSVVLSLAFPAILGGCGRTVTPAELAQYGTRTYPGRSTAQVEHAASVALRSMGFTIVDESGGRIKTAPKLVMVAAAGGKYTAVAVDRSMAWNIEVSAGRDGAVVHATMRPSQAGHTLEATDVNATYAETSFRDLYREIDGNMDGGAPVVSKVSGPTATTSAPIAHDTSATSATPAASSDPPPPVSENMPPPKSDRDSSGPSAAALLGYGFNDGLDVGVGARGGYAWPMHVYVGGMFMYHFGTSQSYTVAGVSASSHVNVYYGGAEGGYELDVGPVVIRPYGGVGPAWVSASVKSSGPAVPVRGAIANTSDVSATDNRIGFWFGGTLLYPVSRQVALGGDARLLVVSDYNTFNLSLTGAYRF